MSNDNGASQDEPIAKSFGEGFRIGLIRSKTAQFGCLTSPSRAAIARPFQPSFTQKKIDPGARNVPHLSVVDSLIALCSVCFSAL